MTETYNTYLGDVWLLVPVQAVRTSVSRFLELELPEFGRFISRPLSVLSGRQKDI